MKNNIFVRFFNRLDSMVKFPNLRSGEIGIQVGFDMSSKNFTTDVIKMYYRVSNTGKVIAIDPDPRNHAMFKKAIEKNSINNIVLVQKGTFALKKKLTLLISQRSSHNRVKSLQSDSYPKNTISSIEIEVDTLDNIIDDLNIDYSRIRHINITNNGSEYQTLLGMNTIFEKCKNLNLSIISGRPGKLGEIHGKKDYQEIIAFLQKRGFTCKFIRMNNSLWWGIIINLIIKRKWIYNKQRYGCILASRGDRKLKFFQSFS